MTHLKATRHRAQRGVFPCLAGTRQPTILGTLSVALVLACAQPRSLAKPGTTCSTGVRPNIILVVGDGLGVQQLGLFEDYARHAPSSIYPGGETALARLARRASLGLSMTSLPGTLIVDSAASATQLASGVGGVNGAVGLDRRQQPVETLLDVAEKKGMATGMITDARVTHSTTASFAAHWSDRNDENEIAEQLAGTSLDLLLGGGLRHFVPPEARRNKNLEARLEKARLNAVTSTRNDEKDLLLAAEQRGFHVVLNDEELDAVADEPVLGLFDDSALMDHMSERRTRSQNRRQPSLARMTEFALRHLGRRKDGFVLVVEAAQIEWAGHANDPGWMLNELMKLDEVIAVIENWMSDREDVLLVLTGDHETGGFGFTYRTGLHSSDHGIDEDDDGIDYGDPTALDRLANQNQSANAWIQAFMGAELRNASTLKHMVNQATELEFSLEEARLALADVELDPPTWSAGKKVRDRVMKTLSSKVNAVWSTTGHTSAPVPVFWAGWGQRALGITDHRQLGSVLKTSVGEHIAGCQGVQSSP